MKARRKVGWRVLARRAMAQVQKAQAAAQRDGDWAGLSELCEAETELRVALSFKTRVPPGSVPEKIQK